MSKKRLQSIGHSPVIEECDRRSQTHGFDVVVLGAGPAGTALAITCLSRSLRVLIIDQSEFPRHAPGETFHPGIESLLAHLGVWNRVRRTVTVWSEGVLVEWGAPARLQRYGGTARDPWKCCHISRMDLDTALLERARSLGVEVWQPCRPEAVLTERGRISGLQTSNGEIRARWIVDATGRAAWLVHRLRLEITRSSPSLVAAYGYVEADPDGPSDLPRITADADGWTWHARISSTTAAWVRTTPPAARPERRWVPPLFDGQKVLDETRFADVGWRCVVEPAGPGYLVVGDAAARLDPARSSGVVKALIGGMTAATSLTAIVCDGAAEAQSLACYRRYVHADFVADTRALCTSYSVFPWWSDRRTHREGEPPWHSSMR